MDAAFRAAETHGIRAILGKVMMDRTTYDPTIDPTTILERSLRESEDLIGRWHGADKGRLGYAVTPRFAISCTADMLRESAALARSTGAWWQTHVSEDPFEIAEVGRLFPDARDYVDVYDRAGGLGPRTVLAHADPSLQARARPADRHRDPRRPLSRLEPVHRRGRHAVGALPRIGLSRSVSGRTSRAALTPRSSRSCGSARTPRWRGGRSPATPSPLSPPSTGCGSGRWAAPGRSGSTSRSVRSRPARRQTSSPSTRRSWRR